MATVLCLAATVTGCSAARPAEPDPRTQHGSRTVGAVDCRRLTQPVQLRQRTSSWTWSKADERWVETWGAWQDLGRTTRVATASDCLRVVRGVPRDAALPDLVVKQLDRCGAGDLEATGGDCFMIVDPAPENPDFPSLAGRKLLFFPVITVNVGAGPLEVIADRPSKETADWTAYQTFYTAGGKRLGSLSAPRVAFYFAGDEHDHWHIRDFDDYELRDATGRVVEKAEKHGYCLQDNTTYGPMQGERGVPEAPGVYLDETSCGKELPDTLTIVHGLSVGWADTYPTTLPDQAIDITDVPDGDYTVTVHADAQGGVVESDERNNTASIEITIDGDHVTTHPATARGGID